MIYSFVLSMLLNVPLFGAGKAFGAPAKGQTIQINASVRIQGGQRLHLSDIVDRTSVSSATLRKLSAIEVGDAPRIGERRTFTAQYVSQLLRKAKLGRDVQFKIPKQVTISYQGYEIEARDVADELVRDWQKYCEGCRLTVTQVKVPVLPIKLKGRPWKLEASTRVPRGSFSEKLVVESSEGDLLVFYVNGQVRVEKQVTVAKRALQPQERLSSGDLKTEWRDTTYAFDGAPSEHEVVGQIAKTMIPSNQVIWATSLQRAKAVRRGDTVKVVTGAGQWQVSLQGITEQDGYVGDRVNVRNSQSKKLISGQVVAPGEVMVE
jgi:flagellar basal body P-ring formation protein FlgA